MRVATTTDPRTTPQIEALARQIAEKQAKQVTRREMDAAEGRWAGTGSALHLATLQMTTGPELDEVRREHSSAKTNLEQLRARARNESEELSELHDQLNGLHRQRRLAAALGAHRVDTKPLPNPLEDAALVSLNQKSAELRVAVARSTTALREAADRRSALEGQASEIRVAVHLGRATRGDLKRVEADALTCRDEQERLDADHEALSMALATIVAEREAREAEVWRQHGPALRDEYARRLQTFAEALRGAAVASEALWAVHELLGYRADRSDPWPDLRLTTDSRFMTWIVAATERGEVK